MIKARESALFALDIYNRAFAVFKSEGYIVMMMIAWTSLLHAVFERDGVDYYCLDKEGNKIIIDDDYKAWDLKECLNKYYSSNENAIRTNLNFFIGLRNKIVHRYVPTIDASIVGECQAIILNFDNLIVEEFGEYYSLKECISVPLQTSNIRTESQQLIIKKYQGKQYSFVKKYIDDFRLKIEDNIYNDPKYSFRVYLMPKIGNHRSSCDTAIDFVNYDKGNPEKMKEIEKQIALIKEKYVPSVNLDKLSPKSVAAEVEKRIGRKFNASYHHSKAYKYYKVRLVEKKNEGCNTKYCQFDYVHKDFVYTSEWVNFLSQELLDPIKYNAIYSTKLK